MIDFEKFKKEQLRLAKKIIIKDFLDKVDKISGIDQAFFNNKIISAVVVLNYKDLELIEKKYFIREIEVPYRAGYLSYREMPAMIEAFRKLENLPDVTLISGNGILHPRRIGLASHFGLNFNISTIGVAKNLLLGKVENNRVYVSDEVRGLVFKSRNYSKPLYISPGHKISLEKSLEIVKNSLKYPHKLPEPLYLAHNYANEIKKYIKKIK